MLHATTQYEGREKGAVGVIHTRVTGTSVGREGSVCAGQSDEHRAGTVLTVDVVTEDSDALLVQSHHLWEVGGFGARIHLHL